MADTTWVGQQYTKLYLTSGEFSTTIKSSASVSGKDASPRGISWDGANTPWGGILGDKLYLNSGQHTSTLLASEVIGSWDNDLRDISWDGTDTPWCGSEAGKLYLQSGQFSGTLKTSQSISGVDSSITGISADDTNTMWTGTTADKLYLQSGRFSSTLLDSEDISAIETGIRGGAYNGTDTIWTGNADDKLYMTSGQFTSTLKTSLSISSVDDNPLGASTGNVGGRLASVVDETILPIAMTISMAINAPTISTGIVIEIAAPLSLGLAAGSGTFPGLPLIVLPPALSLSVALPVPVIEISATIVLIPLALSVAVDLLTPTFIAGADVFVGVDELPMSSAINAITIMGDATLLLPGVPMILLESALSLHAPGIAVTDDIKIIVTNARTFAISEYAAMAFNSMAKFNGKYLYAKANGIYEGGGDDDDGADIIASYKTGSFDINATEVQKLRNAFLNFRSSGDIQLFSVGNEINTRLYNITNSTADTMHERRAKFERGIRDNHFSFGISNVNGSSFEIKTAKILTEPIRKRR